MWTDDYKPKHLEEVAGHAKLKSVIRKYIKTGDIPHFLFHGLQGTGKTLLAELIGQGLLGEDYDTNFILCDASNDRSVGRIRPTVMNAIRNATINGYLRILFFDEADGLMDDSQKFLRGAINKCNNTRFIFACNDITQIKKPIQDRCMCFEFKGVKKGDIIKRLVFIRDNEKAKIELPEVERIAKESGGSMRKAITELEKLSMTGNEEETLLRRYVPK